MTSKNLGTITVAFTEETARIARALPPTVDMYGRTFVFHTAPNLTYQGDRLSKNFDLLIDWNSNPSLADEYYRHLLPNAVVNLTCHPKSLQELKLRDAGIPTPQCYGLLDKEGHGPDVFFTHGDNETVIIRPENSANGAGLAEVPAQQVLEFVTDATDVRVNDLETLSAKYPDVKLGKPENESMFYLGTSQNLCVTRKVPNVEREYRVVFSSNGFYAYPRQINETNGLRHANVDPRSPFPSKPTKLQPADDVLTPQFLGDLRDFVEKEGMTIGCFDVYETTAGFGVFEYSPLFGHRAIPYVELRDLYLAFIVTNCVDKGFFDTDYTLKV